VNADVPQLDVVLLDEDDKYTNPIHIKGIGETAISGAAAAIANAVYNATGVRIYDFPIKLDKLIEQLPDLADIEPVVIGSTGNTDTSGA
jgi:xanthine dehydrogenase YagR molybdenum-binding subunit